MQTNNKLREALETLVDVVDTWKDHFPSAIREGELAKAIKKAEAALAEPVKNYEVGTPAEQTARFAEFCKSHIHSDLPKCAGCPLEGIPDGTGCAQAWAQMPYEEGGAK